MPEDHIDLAYKQMAVQLIIAAFSEKDVHPVEFLRQAIKLVVPVASALRANNPDQIGLELQRWQEEEEQPPAGEPKKSDPNPWLRSRGV